MAASEGKIEGSTFHFPFLRCKAESEAANQEAGPALDKTGPVSSHDVIPRKDMKKKKLDSYKGKLASAQIAEGINAAIQNAKRLAEDAELLFNAERLPSAASLAILSIEESGKISILRALALARNNEDIADAWRDYRSHTKKNVSWLLPQLAAEGARKLDDFKPLFEESSEHPFILDQLKQLGFYTDCLGKVHWSVPEEVIDQPLAKLLVGIATIFAKDNQITTTEIDLWIKHIGPVWKRDPSWMKQALCNWYQEMQEKGLTPAGENRMEAFVKQGL
jgi:AbiV family abortive infection protein